MRRRASAALLALCLLPGLLTASCTPGTAEPVKPALPAGTPPREEARTAGLTVGDLDAFPFTDVPEAAPCRDAVCYAACRGFLQGLGDGSFDPDALVTRAMVVTALRHMAEGRDPGPAERVPAFADVPRDAWYADAADWAGRNGIVTGGDDGTFRPDGPVTRDELAAILCRFAALMGWDAESSGGLEGWLDADRVPAYAAGAMAWAVERGVYAPLVSDSLHPELPVSRGQFAQALLGLSAACEGEPLAVALAGTGPARPAPSASRARHGELQAAVDELGRRYGAIGVQVAVVEDGRVSDTYACGWATRRGRACEAGDPMTAHHQMRVASLSKVLVGIAAMLLREEGAVDLDESIGAYWGTPMRNPYFPDVPVSIRSILSHTSSIRLSDSVAGSHDAVRSRLSSSSGYSRIVPGSISSWGYNNYAFGVLGMTLELAAGQLLDDVLDQRLFQVMDINAAFEPGGLRDTSHLATLYEHGGGVARSVSAQRDLTADPVPGSNGTFFAGGLTISAADLGKIDALLASGGTYEGLRLLSQESVDLMEERSEETVSDGFYQCYPLRYREDLYGRGGLYYHTGSAYGVYACMSYDPETGDGVVVLTTGADGAKDEYGVYAVCGAISELVYRAIA